MSGLERLAQWGGRLAVLLALAAVVTAGTPVSAFDLSRAESRTLENGLTVFALEAPALPVVSVQMLYKVGARDEPVGLTGIAHFLEHMAFRATENFPDTQVVSSIYAVGGEWHGYTWLDQTTYFETLPVEHLDLALRIEADRMTRLLIPEEEVEAERGAVLAEMHGYDNDPASVLKDAVLAVSFLQHPYRNNTIGWEGDVEAIGREDLVEFYRRHYRPANSVLAVVGRISTAEVFERVEKLFGGLARQDPSLPPATVEPPQTGLRRVDLEGPVPGHRFEIAYRAPAVTDPDYPGFLLLQQILAGGAGVNFAQNEFGDPVRAGSRLEGVAEDLVSWFPPQAMPYVLTLAGSIDLGSSRQELEDRVEGAIVRLREEPPEEAELERARRALLDELVFDLETTEDAAHQLAYFEGIGGLEVLLDLPRLLAAVEAQDIRRLARTYLGPERRTVGWYRAKQAQTAEEGVADTGRLRPETASRTFHPGRAGRPPEEVSEPIVTRLSAGLPLIFRRMPQSSSAHLRLILSGASVEVPEVGLGFGSTSGWPLWRRTSVAARFRPPDLVPALRAARRIAHESRAVPAPAATTISDPADRLAATLEELVGKAPDAGRPQPLALVIAGDLSEPEVRRLAEEILGDVEPGELAPGEESGLSAEGREVVIALEPKSAQAQLGYIVAAPPPQDPDWFAWRLLLYILSHGYEGRLGKEAISRRGLVYWIGADYRTDGLAGRASLEIGVDPKNLEVMRGLLRETLDGLTASPPTAAEIAEAKAHLSGRRVSAAQSNEEITAELAAEWVGHGRLLSDAEWAAKLDTVSRDDILRAIPKFVAGVTVVVEVGQ